ncbi:MAG: class I SAM-dependent methyltransferase [SAR202 cluster bacterium]|nr:class I SAM-dependent methyltransferase [SAR202 cluster bacterium]
MLQYEREFELNRRNWNERTAIHLKSPFYDVAGFKAGRNTLMPIELAELGNIVGTPILHLQCHFGLDTLSLQQMGAHATGVDFSDAAIEAARALAEETGLNARFIHSNVYDLPKVHNARYPLVFTSYGVLCWLPDLTLWAQVIAHFLTPGGTFYMVDGHPFGGMFDDSRQDGELVARYPYFHDPAGSFEPGGFPSYTKDAEIVHSGDHEWSHSIGDVLNSLIGAGLRIEFLHEFNVSAYQRLPQMVKGDDGWWRLPEGRLQIPCLYSVKATKPR